MTVQTPSNPTTEFEEVRQTPLSGQETLRARVNEFLEELKEGAPDDQQVIELVLSCLCDTFEHDEVVQEILDMELDALSEPGNDEPAPKF